MPHSAERSGGVVLQFRRAQRETCINPEISVSLTWHIPPALLGWISSDCSGLILILRSELWICRWWIVFHCVGCTLRLPSRPTWEQWAATATTVNVAIRRPMQFDAYSQALPGSRNNSDGLPRVKREAHEKDMDLDIPKDMDWVTRRDELRRHHETQ